jgi:hypothetical protein
VLESVPSETQVGEVLTVPVLTHQIPNYCSFSPMCFCLCDCPTSNTYLLTSSLPTIPLTCITLLGPKLYGFFFFFWDRVLWYCRPGWSQTCSGPASSLPNARITSILHHT